LVSNSMVPRIASRENHVAQAYGSHPESRP
jgi:hypothetical protein